MEATAAKKEDRRTRYTKKEICDAFLRRKRICAYENITVTDICRESEISRGTFYLHYRNIAEVLDYFLGLALAEINTLPEQLSCNGKTCRYPMCQYIRHSDTYRCLFFDESLYFPILNKIFAQHKDEIAQMWKDKTDLSPEQLEMLSYFQFSGCFAAATKSQNLTDAQWEVAQQVIDNFLRGRMGFLPEKIPEQF